MKMLKEPLLHFLLIGLALFGTYRLMQDTGSRGDENAARIERITAEEVEWLKETWARQWQRPPGEDELRGLAADYLREKLLAREARELKLDENDTVVRRRLAQKMTFLIEDTAALAEPREDELHGLYLAQSKLFQAPPRVSFTQIYFSRERRGAEAAADAEAALARLSKPGAPAAPAEAGDASLLERRHAEVDEQAVESVFGADFAREVFALKPGEWQGPIASSYGLHLVRVEARREARLRPYAEVRARVVEEWRRAGQLAAQKAYFGALLEKYNIIVDDSVKPLVGPLLMQSGGRT